MGRSDLFHCACRISRCYFFPHGIAVGSEFMQAVDICWPMVCVLLLGSSELVMAGWPEGPQLVPVQGPFKDTDAWWILRYAYLRAYHVSQSVKLCDSKRKRFSHRVIGVTTHQPTGVTPAISSLFSWPGTKNQLCRLLVTEVSRAKWFFVVCGSSMLLSIINQYWPWLTIMIILIGNRHWWLLLSIIGHNML